MMTDIANKLWVMAFVLVAFVVIVPRIAIAQSPAHQSVEQDGFTLVALITTDMDWQEKWDTPPETIPRFKTDSVIELGDEAILLVFFAGAETHKGAINLVCDLEINKPDGTSASHTDIPCASGEIPGLKTNLRMARLKVGIIAEISDPSGLYTFEVGLTDMVRNLRVSVTVSLEMRIGESDK